MPRLNTTYLSKLREDLHGFAAERQTVIDQSNNALHAAKRAIFALHRQEKSVAEEKLASVEKILGDIQKNYKNGHRMLTEGAYEAALEEYVEAKLFYQFVTSAEITKIAALAIQTETYIAGLCDVPGELYRYAITAATSHDLVTVKRCAETANEIVGELIEFDLTSYLRTKFDQAKQATHKLQEVVYEVTLRK